MNKVMIAAIVACTTLTSPLASAEAPQKMEQMTITYRNSLDYALYQYTIELMSHYRAEIHSSIRRQAKNSSREMADAFFANSADGQIKITKQSKRNQLNAE